jgi:hypothetical protein
MNPITVDEDEFARRVGLGILMNLEKSLIRFRSKKTDFETCPFKHPLSKT